MIYIFYLVILVKYILKRILYNMKNLQYMFDGIPAINHKKNKDINKEKLIILLSILIGK